MDRLTGSRLEGDSAALEGLTFSFLGKLPTLAHRDGNSLISSHGGRVTRAPSSKTDFVVLGENAGKQLEVITKHNLKILTEDQVWSLISERNGNTPTSHDTNRDTALQRPDLVADTSSRPSKRVKLATSEAGVESELNPAEAAKSSKVTIASASGSHGVKEKRLKKYRAQAPLSWLERHNRALTQRMFVIDRTRTGTSTEPEEKIDIAGTTGNIYTVTIKKVPSCTCPDNRIRGNQCKHIIYILAQVLKAPEHLQYQQALVSSVWSLFGELIEIFENAPAPVENASEEKSPGTRKAVEGDCPICFTEFDPEKEDIVWCRAACGNNIHKQCFDQWAISQSGNTVKCVYCRTPWQKEENKSLKGIAQHGQKNKNGYVNVASQLGISTRRDTSTYNQFWVNRSYEELEEDDWV